MEITMTPTKDDNNEAEQLFDKMFPTCTVVKMISQAFADERERNIVDFNKVLSSLGADERNYHG